MPCPSAPTLARHATRARNLLPAALRMMYGEVQPLIAQSLVPGSIWINQQHAKRLATS